MIELRPEFRRAYMREQRGRWWHLRRWWPARNRAYHARRTAAAFTRVKWQCDGMVFGHAYEFVREYQAPPGSNVISMGEPSHVRCTRCGRKAGLGITLSFRESLRLFRTFTDGGPRIDWKPTVPDEHGQAMLDIMERKPVCQREYAYFQDVATCTCQHCVEARRDA
jgi:hypothetical protein